MRACLTVQARGAGRQAGACAVAGRRIRRWWRGATAAGQLAVQEHGRGRGGHTGPDRDQGDLPARHATGADQLDGGQGRREGDGAAVPDRDRVSEGGRGGRRPGPAGRR